MSYEILLTDRGLKIIHLIDRNWLNTPTLIAIGKCIEDAVVRENSGADDSYFYDMLLSKEV